MKHIGIAGFICIGLATISTYTMENEAIDTDILYKLSMAPKAMLIWISFNSEKQDLETFLKTNIHIQEILDGLSDSQAQEIKSNIKHILESESSDFQVKDIKSILMSALKIKSSAKDQIQNMEINSSNKQVQTANLDDIEFLSLNQEDEIEMKSVWKWIKKKGLTVILKITFSSKDLNTFIDNDLDFQLLELSEAEAIEMKSRIGKIIKWINDHVTISKKNGLEIHSKKKSKL